jgi:Fanconi anemia group D2 protein
MPDEHARKLLSVFAILAARKSESGVSVAGSTVPLTVDVNSELYILIRKQLSLSNLKLKRIGIMGAIALLCELAPRSLSTEIETSTISICSDLTLMLLQSCDNNMVAMAFLCDEISRCAPRLHLTLVNRFNDSFTIPKLEQLFIVDVDNEKVNFECSMPLHPWFNLNGSDGVIGLNILGKLFSPDVTERASVLVLTPLFRLGSILLMELGQGLGPIDAMLGCPFVLFDPMCLPDFEQLPMNTRVIYCSALIVCLNLLRELVNAFSSPSAHLTDDDSMPKVCSRMHQVLELQSILARCLNGMPLFVPLGSDELPAAAALDRSLQACTALVAASSKKQSGEKLATIAAFAPRFRAFDIHVFNLLSLPLSGGLEAANSRLHISPACLQYLLKELLEFIQKSLGDKSKSASTSMQPFQLMPFLVPIFQHLGKHLSSLIAEMDKPSVDGDAHADEHSGIDLLGASDRKVTLADCSRLLLEILSAVLNADCLRNNDGHISQSKCVEALAGSAVKVDQFKSVFNKLEALIASLDFSGVVLGIKIMEKLLTLSADLTGKTMTMARTELGSLVHIQLAKTWPTSAKFKADSLGYLVALEISLCVDPIELIERLVLQVFPTIAENGDEPATEIDIHATLNRSTIALYYRSVFAQLIAQVEERMSETHSGITNSVSSRIVSFEKCASIFSNLLTVAKRFAATNSTILSIAIKQGRRFVDVICGFLSFVSVQFTTHREIVMTGIRLMQVGTRNLQAMCEHGKRERDVSVTAVVPFVKRSLEDFMYGVKSMFQQHQLLSAFKVGNLKAKALDGTVLSSQEDIESEKEEESEQQQLPARLSLRRNTKAAKSKEQEPASDDDQGHASESDHSIAEEPIGKGKLAQQSRSRQPKRARSESEPEDDEEADDVDESENEATESDQVSDELTDDEQPDEDQYDSAMLADSSEEDPEVEEDEEPVRKKRHSKQLSSSARRKLKHLKRSRRHNDDDEAEEQEY